ncbi:NAD(P)H-dependent oxidoreductase [Ilumatobacter nonamiensis]|uniref:NAD(P)H-dependent oxidoreductase n=1 Tax=Ilumatobacter nonamiensis TaxID=467093 RepID=UPI00034712A3|nr:NAD(P)H-dependent oxidoreductase [Ilumatobacter nonamiensis]
MRRDRRRRVLVIHCHPATDAFISTALERVTAGLKESGADVRIHDLYREEFVPELSAAEHRAHLRPGVADDLDEHAEDLQWCDTLVLVYPTWWSGQPAMLKGWIDRVWASGVAWELPDGASRLRPRLRNVRRLVVVTSHGSSKLVNSLQGEGGKRTVFRSLRTMCHPLTRTHWLAFYGIDNASSDSRTRFLEALPDRIARIVH